MKPRTIALLIVAVVALVAACSKPLVTAKVSESPDYYSSDYAATANDIYYALKWALRDLHYAIDSENLQEGVVTTTWLPVKSDSHYLGVFGRPDYGVTNSYYQLRVTVEPQGGRTEVKVESCVKGIVPYLKSSGVEERKLLSAIGNYLRKGEPDISNLGIDE